MTKAMQKRTTSIRKKANGKPARKGLSDKEMQAQGGSELPDREAMSLINADIAAPINAAVAANVLSDGSTADATAIQYAPITQST